MGGLGNAWIFSSLNPSVTPSPILLMPDIVLTTLNARYAHAAFGLRYLRANLGALRDRSTIVEFTINDAPLDILDVLLEQNPKIIGVSVSIWNVEPSTKLVADLKRVRPDIVIVLGGPEVSYETDDQEIVRLADYVVTGEGDIAFASLCGKLLSGERPAEKIIPAPLPDFVNLRLPYDEYLDRDIASRAIYVEASRGCPYRCEFCLSSLEIPVRQAPLEPFLAAMQSLLDRGCRQFKFVDRTFNLNLRVSGAILEFFLDRYEPGLFLHFELIPDRLPDPLRAIIARFPPGVLQFEVGVQTFNDEVSHLISRMQDNARLAENFRFLRDETGVHVHADLIVGLPGETVESFAAGFDRLVALRPQEIQVGILKRLRGTPIIRHDAEWGMRYSLHPPYEILQNRLIDFATMQRVRRFARYWDLVANSGNFVETTPELWAGRSPFEGFMAFCEWLFETEGRKHGIPLTRLVERIHRYLVETLGRDGEEIAELLWRDYQRGGRSDMPLCLRQYGLAPASTRRPQSSGKRQARHGLVPSRPGDK